MNVLIVQIEGREWRFKCPNHPDKQKLAQMGRAWAKSHGWTYVGVQTR